MPDWKRPKARPQIAGQELGFSRRWTSSPGLPYCCPGRAQSDSPALWEDEESWGYLLTKTPFMAKRDLYKISGHWDHYRGHVYLGDPDARQCSPCGRDLPLPVPGYHPHALLPRPAALTKPPRCFERGLRRMHRLIRVRQFTISEGHIACTPEQLEDEFRGCGFGDVYAQSRRFRRRRPTASPNGTKQQGKIYRLGEQWEQVQSRMSDILGDLGIDYTETDGEAAFYGPAGHSDQKRARQRGRWSCR